MEQIQFTEDAKDGFINKLIDELVEELHKYQFELVTQEKLENFEDAAQLQIRIDQMIEFANQALLSWSGLDIKENLIKESNFIREQIQQNYDLIIEEYNKNNDGE